MHHSHPNVSNPGDANCATLLPGAPSHRRCPSARPANPACDTTTPLGAPVDPDV